MSEGASTIHLPVKECHITEGTNCTMYGWGETKSTAFFHPICQRHLCISTIIQNKYLKHLTITLHVLLCSDTGYDEALNALTMPMVNNDMCSQIKGDAGESRICAGGKRGEGVCDVRTEMQHDCTLIKRFCHPNITWQHLDSQFSPELLFFVDYLD